jgi:hypothetical protein
MASTPATDGGAQRRPWGSGRHRAAVTDAEVRRLVRALHAYGALRRSSLAREVGAVSWRDGGFDRSLSAAVRTGRVQRLPFDFYRLPSATGRR